MVWTALERVGCTIPDEGAGDRSGQIDVGTENGGGLLPLSNLLVLVGHSDGSLWMGHRSTNATVCLLVWIKHHNARQNTSAIVACPPTFAEGHAAKKDRTLIFDRMFTTKVVLLQ